MPSKKIQVLLADDHAILRKGVKMLIDSQDDMEVVGEAKTGREAIEQAQSLNPDIVVMDISMPELNGIEGTRQICDSLPKTKVIALSMHKDSVYVREILRAIRSVNRGEAFLSPAISDAILIDYRRFVSNPVDLLTSREREVLTMIAEGQTNKDIANALSLSVYTVESHRGSLMGKLNLHSTGDILRFGIRNGLTS